MEDDPDIYPESQMLETVFQPLAMIKG